MPSSVSLAVPVKTIGAPLVKLALLAGDEICTVGAAFCGPPHDAGLVNDSVPLKKQSPMAQISWPDAPTPIPNCEKASQTVHVACCLSSPVGQLLDGREDAVAHLLVSGLWRRVVQPVHQIAEQRWPEATLC